MFSLNKNRFSDVFEMFSAHFGQILLFWFKKKEAFKQCFEK